MTEEESNGRDVFEDRVRELGLTYKHLIYFHFNNNEKEDKIIGIISSKEKVINLLNFVKEIAEKNGAKTTLTVSEEDLEKINDNRFYNEVKLEVSKGYYYVKTCFSDDAFYVDNF